METLAANQMLAFTTPHHLQHDTADPQLIAVCALFQEFCYDCSPGTNVVAIDNRIEQAMDLVKTHLMYAVREEVESLKEKIGDLERKVSRLERENQILREHASPEILAQIQQAIVAAGGGQSSVLPQLAGFAPPPAILQTPPSASPFLHQQPAPPVPVVVTKEP